MQSHPRWIAHYQVEAATRRHVGELRRERERQRAAVSGSSPKLAERRRLPPQIEGGQLLVMSRDAAVAEQVATAARGYEIPTTILQRIEIGIQRKEHAPPLGLLETTRERLFPRAGGACVSTA